MEVESNFCYIVVACRGFLLPDDTSSNLSKLFVMDTGMSEAAIGAVHSEGDGSGNHGVHLAEATALNHPSRFIEAVCYGHVHERSSYWRRTFLRRWKWKLKQQLLITLPDLLKLFVMDTGTSEAATDVVQSTCMLTFGRRKRKNADVVSRQHCGAAEKPRHWLPQRWWTRNWFCARVASFYIEEAVVRMHTKRMNASGCELRVGECRKRCTAEYCFPETGSRTNLNQPAIPKFRPENRQVAWTAHFGEAGGGKGGDEKCATVERPVHQEVIVPTENNNMVCIMITGNIGRRLGKCFQISTI
ncbi:hypothetical protein T11_17927 [Trichinella zimbabwensis]|uniref:Uncharacterized protein n=1 Tax=Trichinella zimbabwensis TaxID=268475 RepID=A0A0V1HJR5_9BILA|nr:hypothetical protein T11_17927 [Trichinella zimbabwensis]